MTSIASDLRLARRQITKSPTFSAIVIATLALAIGLNTAVFSAVDAIFLRPLPGVHRSGELVQLYRSWPGMTYGSNSIPHWRDVRERSRSTFSDVALWTFAPMNLSSGEVPQRVMGAVVSASYFNVMGAVPAMGRFFVAAEDTGRLAHPVAVLSYGAWQSLFGADPAIVGRHVRVNGSPYEIVGVTAAAFRGVIPMVTPALWTPLTQMEHVMPNTAALWESRGNNFFNVIARVAPGVPADAAQARMDQLSASLKADLAGDYDRSGITAVPQSKVGIHPSFQSAQVGLTAVVMSVVGILLLIACVNVANLFLARARDRAREMAVRIAIGATRSVLVRQLLVESLVFAVVSAAAGLGVAQFAMSLANQISLPVDVDFSIGLTLSAPVLVFTVAAAVVAAVAFGIAPALAATRPSLVPALKGEAPAGESRSRVRSGLVVAQMALSMVLLVCAGLFLRNLEAATSVDKGFDPTNVLTAEMDPGMQGLDRAGVETFYRTLVERLRAQPQVAHVATAATLPLGLSNSDRGVEVPGYTPRPDESMSIGTSFVSEGYFDAMGIAVRGRAILASDDSTAPQVLVVNQRFVDRFLSGREPIGATVRTAGRDHVIVGVVPTGKYRSLGERPTAFMYFSDRQQYRSGRVVVVRTAGAPDALAPALRVEVRQLDATLPISNVRTMYNAIGAALLPARLTGSVLGAFGVIGLLLAALGIYGVTGYAVVQRTREIGIRVAIGASAGDVVGLFVRQALRLVTIGAALGIAGALAASRALGSVLYANGQNDAVTFLAVPLVLMGVAVLATWLPARRAALVDPLVALRQE